MTVPSWPTPTAWAASARGDAGHCLSPFFSFRLLPRNILAKTAPFLPAGCPGETGLEPPAPGLHCSGTMQTSKAVTTGADGRCPKASLAPTRPRHALGKPGRTSCLAPDTRSKSTTPLPPDVPSKHHTGCPEPTRSGGKGRRGSPPCWSRGLAPTMHVLHPLQHAHSSLRHSSTSLIQALGSAMPGSKCSRG